VNLRSAFYDPGVDLSKTQRLILRALDGQEADRGKMLEYLRPRLVLWANSRLSGALRAKVEPDDVVQETLIAVHKSMDRFEGRDHRAFLGWVFRIAENRIRDMADYFGAKKRQPDALVTFTQTSPSTAASRIEEVDKVAAALADLGEDHREVIRLRRFEERDVKEIGELMDRSENAVRILYCRALKALRQIMAQKESEREGPAAGDSKSRQVHEA
jgi:RNA polymerase sigma-70 factor (ECF subfamily)